MNIQNAQKDRANGFLEYWGNVYRVKRGNGKNGHNHLSTVTVTRNCSHIGNGRIMSLLLYFTPCHFGVNCCFKYKESKGTGSVTVTEMCTLQMHSGSNSFIKSIRVYGAMDCNLQFITFRSHIIKVPYLVSVH